MIKLILLGVLLCLIGLLVFVILAGAGLLEPAARLMHKEFLATKRRVEFGIFCLQLVGAAVGIVLAVTGLDGNKRLSAAISAAALIGVMLAARFLYRRLEELDKQN